MKLEEQFAINKKMKEQLLINKTRGTVCNLVWAVSWEVRGTIILLVKLEKQQSTLL